ncbi:MAG: HAD-IA family hydrolase [Bacteroidia bacterium]
MEIELVVFDIAGTTVKDNGEIAIAFQSAFFDYGYKIPLESINPLMGYKKSEAIKKILIEFEPNKEKITEILIDIVHRKFRRIMVEYYSQTQDLQPLPYAEEIFEYLHSKNIKVGLDTGFSKEITDVIIERLGWLRDKKIDAYVCSDEVEFGRPHPFMIAKIMATLNLSDVTKIIKIGDTEVDINEGINAGCKYSIGITTGAYSEDELNPHNPSFIINSLQELIPIIEPLL